MYYIGIFWCNGLFIYLFNINLNHLHSMNDDKVNFSQWKQHDKFAQLKLVVLVRGGMLMGRG